MSRTHWAAYFLTALGGTALGAGITIKFLDAEYEKNLAIESEKSRKYWSKLHKRGEFSDPASIVEEKAEQIAEKIIEKAEYAPSVVADHVNIFTGEPKQFDLGEEIQRRSPDRPYVIAEEEFFANETGYEQIHLMFYTQDAALADQGDEYIRESDDIVGDDNLLRFGEGSNDKNIVYIRNDRLEKEYEVVRTKGSYQEIVHGIALEHSSDKKRKVSKRPRREE